MTDVKKKISRGLMRLWDGVARLVQTDVCLLDLYKSQRFIRGVDIGENGLLLFMLRVTSAL